MFTLDQLNLYATNQIINKIKDARLLIMGSARPGWQYDHSDEPIVIPKRWCNEPVFMSTHESKVSIFGKRTQDDDATFDCGYYFYKSTYVMSNIKFIDNEFVVFPHNVNDKCIVPMTEAYIVKDYQTLYIGMRFTFIRTDELRKDIHKERYLSYNNSRALTRLRIHIEDTNKTFQSKLDVLRSKTKRHREELDSLNLLPVVIIETLDNNIKIYPPTLPLAYEITAGPLLSISWSDTKIIKINHKNNVVTYFWKVLYQDTLPVLDNIINHEAFTKDLLTQLLILADYFCIGFYMEYFTTITQSDEYQQLINH